MAATGYVTTVSGSATSFLPLTTSGISIGADCASAIYKQANDGEFLGWDPWWVTEVNSDLSTCWPPEATSWWNQDSSEMTTVLGTSFVCPSAYHEVLTSSIDAHTTQTFCCPTSYSLYNVEFDRPSFPSQCISTLTEGETLRYRTVTTLASDSITNSATSTTVAAGIITIYGIPVNGLNVNSSTSASVTLSTTSNAGAGEANTASASALSAQSSSSSPGGHSSVVGVAVGASVGVVAGILLLSVGLLMLWRKKKRHLAYASPEPAHEMAASPSDPKKGLGPTMGASSSGMLSNYAAELDSGRNHAVYELPVDTRRGYGRDII